MYKKEIGHYSESPPDFEMFLGAIQKVPQSEWGKGINEKSDKKWCRGGGLTIKVMSLIQNFSCV